MLRNANTSTNAKKVIKEESRTKAGGWPTELSTEELQHPDQSERVPSKWTLTQCLHVEHSAKCCYT